MRNSQKRLINSDDLEKEIEKDTINIHRIISFENFFIKTSKLFSYTCCIALISIFTVISTCIVILHYKPYTIPALYTILKQHLTPIKFQNYEIILKKFQPHIILYFSKYKNFEIDKLELSLKLKESFLKKRLIIDKIILIKPHIEIYKSNKNFFVKTKLSKDNEEKINVSLHDIINTFFNNKIEIKNGSLKIFDKSHDIAYFKNISAYKNKNSSIKLSVNNNFNNGNVEISYAPKTSFFITTFNNIPYKYIKFFLNTNVNIDMQNSFLTGKIITHIKDKFQKHNFIIKSPIANVKFNDQNSIITNLFIKGEIYKNLTNITQLSFFYKSSNINIHNFKISNEGFFLENSKILCTDLKNMFIQKFFQSINYNKLYFFSKFDVKNCNLKISGLLSKKKPKISNIEGTVHLQKADIKSKNIELTNLNLKGSFKNENLFMNIQSGLFNKFNNISTGKIKKIGNNVQVSVRSSIPISVFKQYINDNNIQNVSGYLSGNFLIESQDNFQNFDIKNVAGKLKIENGTLLNQKFYSKNNVNFIYADKILKINGIIFVNNKPIYLKNFYKDYNQNKFVTEFSGEFDSTFINTLIENKFFIGTSVNEVRITQDKYITKYNIMSDIKHTEIYVPNLIYLKKIQENGIGIFDIIKNNSRKNIAFNISTENNSISGNISNKNGKIYSANINIKGTNNINCVINNYNKYNIKGCNITVTTNDILKYINGNFIIDLKNVKYNSVIFDIKGYAKVHNSILDNSEINISGKNTVFSIKSNSNSQVANINISSTNPKFFINLLDIKQQDLLNINDHGELFINYVQDKKSNKKSGKIKLKNFTIKNIDNISNILTLTSINGSAGANYIGFNNFSCNFDTFKNMISISNISAKGPVICFTGNGIMNTLINDIKIQGFVINDYYRNINLYAKYVIKGNYYSPVISISPLIKDKEENINKIFGIKNIIKTYNQQLDKQPLHLTF